MMDVLLLCAGFGTRMRQLTRDVPKPLLITRNERIIDRLISQLETLDTVSNIYINVSYRAQEFADWLISKELNNNITFIWEHFPFGGLKTLQNFSEIAKHKCLVIHGDLYLAPLLLAKFVTSCSQEDENYVGVHRRSAIGSRSNLIIDNKSLVLEFREGESSPLSQEVFSNSGIYLFSKKLITEKVNEFCGNNIAAHLLPKLSEQRLLRAVEVQGFRYSLETTDDIIRINSGEFTE